jgi:hypothetical protein
MKTSWESRHCSRYAEEKKVNNCINCKNYERQQCNAGHNYDNVIKSSFNTGFDIECKEFKHKS